MPVMLEMLVGGFLQTLKDYVTNIVVLFALIFLYALTNLDPKSNSTRRKAIYGLIIGGFSVLVMLTAVQMENGVFFDTRTILFSVTGIFFGPLTTIIAAAIGIIYRASIGNDGVITGILTIMVSASIGLIWKYIRKMFRFKVPMFLEALGFSLFVHIMTLFCFFALLPLDSGLQAIKDNAFVFLVVFPIVSALTALALHNQRRRLDNAILIEQQRLLLQASIDSNLNVEVYALDKNYNYLSFNTFHKLSMEEFHDCKIELGRNFFDYLVKSPDIATRLTATFDKVLAGTPLKSVVEVETSPGTFLDEIYTPIYNDVREVIGLTVFSQDVTKQKEYENSIIYINYHDTLTGLKNRRFFNEQIELLKDEPKALPLTIIQADINGLKIMNDAFGHDAGDELLVTVARIMCETFDQPNCISRMGGDEFIIILKNTTRKEALSLIDKVNEKLSSVLLRGLSVSVSFGAFTKASDEPLDEVIRIAEEEMYQNKLLEVNSNRKEAIKTFLSTLYQKSPTEKEHSKRVGELSVEIGKKLGLDQENLDLLERIGQLHDIGKVAIDKSILNKKTPLTKNEWEILKKHPEIGYRILASSSDYADVAYDILSQHERYDGKGYPRGLKGKHIPFRARIVTVADAFDTMTNDCTYRKAIGIHEAINRLEENAGTQFDSEIVSALVSIIKDSTTDFFK